VRRGPRGACTPGIWFKGASKKLKSIMINKIGDEYF
jgi:hypothetical protein